MKFAIIADLHIGHTGSGCWHNRLLYDHAEIITRAAVAALNSESLDAVYVLGDITEAGEAEQLTLAHAILAELHAPWFVVPGNHDRAAVQSGAFDTVFRDHLVPEYAMYDNIAVAALREHRMTTDGSTDRYHLDETRLTKLADQLDQSRPAVLFLFSHQPVLSEPAWAAVHAGKDAGYFSNGQRFISQAEELTDHVAMFCGHQHWHHVIAGPGWVQCTTAALIEYPMEARIVTCDGTALTSRLLPVAASLAMMSLEHAEWVRGRDEDREWCHDFALIPGRHEKIG